MSEPLPRLHLLVEGQTEETFVRDHLGELHPVNGLAELLRADIAAAGGLEQINDGAETAPSKRLLRYCPTYAKTSDGPLVVSEFGLERLRKCCPHLDGWLQAIEARAS